MLSDSFLATVTDILGVNASEKELAAWQKLLDAFCAHFNTGLQQARSNQNCSNRNRADGTNFPQQRNRTDLKSPKPSQSLKSNPRNLSFTFSYSSKNTEKL